jgi:DNA polymerase III sliding clamp (beta) subunit (PCNA family)
MQKAELRIPAAVTQLWRFLSTDESRHVINYLLVERYLDTWVAVATDGYRLVKVSWTRDSDEDLPEGKLYIPQPDLKRLATLAKKSDVKLTIQDGVATATTAQNASLRVELGDAGKIYYPDYSRAIPSETQDCTDATQIGVNPQYLAEMSDHARKYILDPKSPLHIDLKFWSGPLEPLVFSASSATRGLQATYVIMPSR